MQRSIQDDGKNDRFADDCLEDQLLLTCDRVFKLAYRMLDNHSDAEDITQETMLRAWTRYETFDTTSSFYTWVRRIAINLCIDHLRYANALPFFLLISC